MSAVVTRRRAAPDAAPSSQRIVRPLGLPVKFVRFCLVGASGVLVNLGSLYALADLLGVHTNVAAALAIEISIISNFLLNDAWTFRSQRAGRPFRSRLTRFHLVSFLGAAIQWCAFVTTNALAYLWLIDGSTRSGGSLSFVGAIVAPPDVGDWKYGSQMVGIALATMWNFLANNFWTWKLSLRRQSPVELRKRDRGS